MIRVAAAKTLIIGLDVGDGSLILEWARRGHLPTLASLLDRGDWTWLDTTADTLHVSAWPSIYTGTGPGEHGVYYTFQPAPGRQGYAKFSAGQYGRPSFWNLLSQAGVRCTVFDAPYTYPEPGSNAVQIFEWGTWARHWKPMSIPGPLFRRLKRECGAYPLGIEALDIGLASLDANEMERRLVESARAKSRAAAWVMGQSPWDIFFAVYGETHPGAHYCWADPDAVTQSSDQPRLRPIYEEIDRGIAALLEQAGEGIDVYVVSGDGVGPNRAGWHLLPEVLRRLGYLAEPPESHAVEEDTEKDSAANHRRSRDPIRRLRDALPRDLRKALARKLPSALRHRLAQRVDTAAIDWSKTRAFCLPTDLEGYIRINLRGREPEGIVSAGAEYNDLCEELIAALSGLCDPESGRPAVRQIVRTDDVVHGPRRHYLPDLIVIWNRDLPLTALTSPAIGTVTGVSPDARTGTHAPPGFLLRAGPGIARGGVEQHGHICDFARELFARYGVNVPDHMSAHHSMSERGAS